MDQLVAASTSPPPSPTDAAVRALERLRSDLGARHRIPGGRITANAGIAVLALQDLHVWCHRGAEFTWSAGRVPGGRAVLAKAAADPLHEAGDRVAARYRQVHGYQPAPARRAG